jgi:SPOR domain
MSMANDYTQRSYRTTDSNRRAAEPKEPAGASDPLAELARLIGQSDPFAEFGRSNQRQPQQASYAPPERYAPAGGSPARDDWQHDPAREDQFAPDYSRLPTRDDYSPSADYGHPPAHDPHSERWQPDSHRYDGLRPEADYRGQHDDQGQHYADDRMHGSVEHHGPEPDQRYQDEPYYQDDVPLAPHDDESYDDAPGKRPLSGLATALALIGCAMLGTAGAYAYRSYYAPLDAMQPPPVITADSSMPTKIVPTTAVDPQSSKASQDQVANAGREQIVTKQEEPIALKEVGTQTAPRVVLPAPVPPVQGAAATPSTAAPPTGPGEPKKVRTVTIRPDGTDVSGRPVGLPPPTGRAPDTTATTRPATPPAQKATAPATAPARSGGPLSLDPQTGEPRTAALAPARTAPEPATGTTGGYVVQLSSQKSESDAKAVFRSLQAKFPNELGDRQPIVRRADLGAKGVFFRTMVGPFASQQEAAKFCASYKAAGGQCVVPNN